MRVVATPDRAFIFIEAVQRGDALEVARMLSGEPQLARASGDYAKTALHWAAEKDHVEIARLLLDAGADIESTTAWGAAPLEWAAVMGSTRVADLLLSRGAAGLTLVTAAALGKLDAVRTIAGRGDLTRQSRRVMATSEDEWPSDTANAQGDVLSDAMYSAARNGHDAVVTFLLDRGARVDAKGFFGATGLHWAAINGHRSTVDLLLSRGASRTVRDARFKATPDSWAEEGGHFEIAETLRSG
jgi:ankyrin repeat protein